MKNRIKQFTLTLAVLLAGCADEKEGLALPADLAIRRFEVAGTVGTIENDPSTIRVRVPAATDLADIRPEIELTAGATVTPASGERVDFSGRTVTYRVCAGDLYRDYTVRVAHAIGDKIAFVGWEDMPSSAAEEQAWQWLSEESGIARAEKISLWEVETEAVSLDDYAVIWWHCDGLADAQQLPFRAYRTKVIALFRDYLANGGNLLLTTYASQWVRELEVAADKCIPNNVWGGDVTLAPEDTRGISYRGNEKHPLFSGFEYADGMLPLMSGGVTFAEHNIIWHTGWQNYDGSLAVWMERTGGKALVSDMDGTKPRILVAEFPATDARPGRVITFGMGCYQWNAAGNGCRRNIERLTANALTYLAEKEL